MRTRGLEPASLEWHSKAQPIDQARICWTSAGESNPVMADLQPAAFPPRPRLILKEEIGWHGWNRTSLILG